MSSKTNIDKVEGLITEALPNTLFRVKLDDDREILSYISGKMRLYRIRILVGDRVSVEIGDGQERGRIVYRHK